MACLKQTKCPLFVRLLEPVALVQESALHISLVESRRRCLPKLQIAARYQRQVWQEAKRSDTAATSKFIVVPMFAERKGPEKLEH